MSRHQPFLFEDCAPTSISQERAQELLEPRLPMLTNALQGAFDEFKTGITPGTRRKLKNGVRGQNVTNLIWEHVRDEFTGCEGIEFCDRLGFFKLLIENEVIVRFKRLNSNLLAMSKATEQAVAWFGNEPLAGISDTLLRVNFGYQPEAGWTSCEKFYLTHQSSFSRVSWVSRLQVLRDEPVSSSPPHGLRAIEIIPISSPSSQRREHA